MRRNHHERAVFTGFIGGHGVSGTPIVQTVNPGTCSGPDRRPAIQSLISLACDTWTKSPPDQKVAKIYSVQTKRSMKRSATMGTVEQKSDCRKRAQRAQKLFQLSLPHEVQSCFTWDWPMKSCSIFHRASISVFCSSSCQFVKFVSAFPCRVEAQSEDGSLQPSAFSLCPLSGSAMGTAEWNAGCP